MSAIARKLPNHLLDIVKMKKKVKMETAIIDVQ